MRKSKGVKRKISLHNIILCLMICYVPTIMASTGGFYLLKNNQKTYIDKIAVLSQKTPVYYEVAKGKGRIECKIDDAYYGISYASPAKFEIDPKDFDTTYHTIRFVVYNEKDKLVGKKEYLLKLNLKREVDKRSSRKAKNFQKNDKPIYKRDYVPILMYHDIVTNVKNNSAQVSVEQFKSQLSTLLNEGYTPINFVDYMNYKEGKGGLPKKPILITFDDGYKSNYTNAYPVLRDKSIEATFFVPTKVVGKQTTANNHFTWEQAKEMEKSGLIDIQSHTYSHCNMSKLGENELLLEVTKSFETIENHLGTRDIKVLCYPEFKNSKKSRQVCSDAGVNLQITDLATPGRFTDYPTKLRRIHVHNHLSGQELVREIKNLTM